MSATHSTAHGNAGSLSHWARPGIGPASTWMLVRFVSSEPWWELLHSFLRLNDIPLYVELFFFFFFFHPYSIWKLLGQGWIWAGAATYAIATAAAMVDPSLIHCSELGIKPAPPQRQARSLTYCAIMRTVYHIFKSVHVLMDIWIVFQMWTMLLWTWVYRCLLWIFFSFVLAVPVTYGSSPGQGLNLHYNSL